MIDINKIKKVISILLVFFIVLSTNLVDKKNFNRLKESVTTIYKDRIVASDLLFDISLLIHKKEIAIISSDSLFLEKRNNINDQINGYIAQYEQTKLTGKEEASFENLKSELNELNKLEKSFTYSTTNNNHKELLQRIEIISLHLKNLSKIQLNEGKQQMFMSHKAMKAIDIFTQIEIIFLVLMAIMVQIIIFYDSKKKSK